MTLVNVIKCFCLNKQICFNFLPFLIINDFINGFVVDICQGVCQAGCDTYLPVLTREPQFVAFADNILYSVLMREPILIMKKKVATWQN